MVTHAFFALLNGASLLPFDVQRNGINRIPQWLLEEKITFLPISPSLFRNVCENLTGNEKFPNLRLLRVGSETARKTDVELYRKYFSSDCVMFNALNSSEAGVLRFFFINHNTEIAEPEVPAGYPLEDKEILLLDDSGREVGYNTTAEIVVRSRYLSPGYWRNPELTATKFKDDPQGGGSRLYFSGDLGLMLPDGCLVLKGRKDFRVKIRGYGVEIAEVENALCEHSKVKEVVVVARKNDLGEDYLIAYFTTSDREAVCANELRAFLKSRFPNYMIPSRFILRERLPLTPRGKIDRQALPDPGKSRPEIGTPYVAARTPIEKQLAEIWAEVLSVDRVGIQDDFFDLGGHSLAAAKIIARVIQGFQLELPVTALFDSPTVTDMATVIVANETKRASERDLVRMLNEVEVMSDEEAMRAFVNTAEKT
jgi:acyl-coenzyme A synthetase/AMP-(fatty) acid ligase/acyl carrier protein